MGGSEGLVFFAEVYVGSLAITKPEEVDRAGVEAGFLVVGA
jgi:hypothetical protein